MDVATIAADAPRRATVEEMATREGTSAALGIFFGGGRVEMWATDASAGRTLMQNLPLDQGAPDRRATIVAVKAVDLLKATLAEIWSAPPPPGESAEPPPEPVVVAPPPPPVAVVIEHPRRTTTAEARRSLLAHRRRGLAAGGQRQRLGARDCALDGAGRLRPGGAPDAVGARVEHRRHPDERVGAAHAADRTGRAAALVARLAPPARRAGDRRGRAPPVDRRDRRARLPEREPAAPGRPRPAPAPASRGTFTRT